MKIRVAYQMMQTNLYTDQVLPSADIGEFLNIENTKTSLNVPSVDHHIHQVWKPLWSRC
jgi:hypothetical protein